MAFRLRAVELLPLVPAAALPLLVLHRMYQPVSTSIGPLHVFSSDIAVGLVVLAALYAGFRFGWAPLRSPLVLWVLAALLIGLLLVSCFYRPHMLTKKHLVTLSKIGEYALLAPSVVLLLRRRVDFDRFLAAFVAVNVSASIWGILEFLGLVNEFFGRRPAQREVSYIGIHDFAVFSGMTLMIGIAGIVLGRRGWLVRVALATGIAGTILPASVFAYAGVVVAALLALLVGRRAGTLTARRALAVVVTVAVVGAGVYELRGSDVSNFLSFLGRATPTKSEEENIQTGAQHVLLAYIGFKMWEAHPWLGVGFDRSTTEYAPYIPAAKRRFPNQAPSSFPSPAHAWGVQNLWVQSLADTGVVGGVLLLATFVAALVLAVRAFGPRPFLGFVLVSWIVVAAATWNAVGDVAGVPIAALTWLTFGLAAAAARVA